LDAWLDASRIGKAAATVGDLTLFYLSYQEEDNKPLLAQYGALCNRIMAHWQKQQNYHCSTLASAGRIKVGIVSNHIKAHSVWFALTKGWVQNFARDKLELHIFYTGKDFDSQTALAQAKATSFVQGELTLTQWTEAILSHQIEALVFPEIGMDPMTMKLANLRLAPVQIAAWGHPETSGLPSIDYFVSAQGIEPENAQRYYTERLIQLPNLGCNYQLLNVTARAPDLPKLGIKEGYPLLICPGTPYKYAPQYDGILVEIAQRLGLCQFIFFTFGLENDLTGKLKQRLQRKFKDSGLELDDFALFIPWLEAPEFYGLMQRADVYLDTIGFSGFNTAMQAVQCSLPIVTREGRFMRGRLASGILKQLGVQELVAANEEDYIELTVKLVQDKAFSQSVSQRIGQASPRLLNDLQPIRAMEDFLMEVCRGSKAKS
jgi:predicted O-linked N-acetylglucosamine transferase (SPINDLY family)